MPNAFCIAAAVLFLVAAPAPPDLRVLWSDGGSILEGDAGTTLVVPYSIRNVGGRDAFAVIVRPSTALGPVTPQRFQPGPSAGGALERTVTIPLAHGMRDLCVDVILQNLEIDDPPDPNLADNRICRAIQVRNKK